MNITIIGCGYTGRVILPSLIKDGHALTVTTTSDQNHALFKQMGARPVTLHQEDPLQEYQNSLDQAEGLIFLAPPIAELSATEVAKKISDSAPHLKVCVYGSTTGVYPCAQDQWTDESTPAGPQNPRGKRRAEMEDALKQSGLNTKVVRIAGIYGPGRTLARRIQDPDWPLFEGGAVTSRIHVDDLAEILIGMLNLDAPDLVNACDEAPTTTLEVARYTAKLLGVDLPELVTAQEAQMRMSETAWSFRNTSRRCRSLCRHKALKQLMFPTYKEGVEASLRAEGLI